MQLLSQATALNLKKLIYYEKTVTKKSVDKVSFTFSIYVRKNTNCYIFLDDGGDRDRIYKAPVNCQNQKPFFHALPLDNS